MHYRSTPQGSANGFASLFGARADVDFAASHSGSGMPCAGAGAGAAPTKDAQAMTVASVER